MAHGGTDSPARKAKAVLTEVDTREVSTVDRPAIGERFLIVKSEAGMAGKVKAGAPVRKDEVEAAAPKVVASGEPQPPEALGAAATAKDDDEVSMALPAAAKGAIVAGLTAAQGRIAALLASASGSTDAAEEGAEVPGEFLVSVLDVASGLARLVEPYAGSAGMVDDLEKGADGKPIAPVAKADGAPAARCTWTPEYIDSLCDWDFLDVTPSMDRDTEYRTQPLSNRHFPIRDHAGRLCLAAVLDAIDALATPTPALAPWLTDSKRVELLLRLACMRLDEVAIAIRRDGMAPESAAELNGIAELLEMVSGTGGAAAEGEAATAAAPAPGATAEADKAANAATSGEQPIGPAGATNAPATATPPADLPQLAQKAAAIFRAVAKSGGAPMLAEHHVAIKAAHAAMAKALSAATEAGGHLEKCLKAVDPYFEGKLGDANPQAEFGTPPNAGAANPTGAAAKPADTMAQPADAGVTKALADAKVALAKSEADRKALLVRVAKAERAVQPSRLGGHSETEPVAKNGAGTTPPLAMDLNEVFKAEEVAKSATSTAAR